MGFWQVGVGLVYLFALGFSEAQLRPRGRSVWTPSIFMPTVQAQQTDSRMPPIPQRSGPGNPASALQGFPTQFPVQTPARSDFGRPSQDLFGIQSKELMLGPVTKLTWRFPSLPEEPQRPDSPFELHHRVPANSVAAQCGENSIYVEVMEDFFGTGKPLRSSAFTLGGCTATGEDPSAQVLIFESELHGCGSIVMVRCFNFPFCDSEGFID